MLNASTFKKDSQKEESIITVNTKKYEDELFKCKDNKSFELSSTNECIFYFDPEIKTRKATKMTLLQAVKPFLNFEKSSAAVILLHGAAGSGKTLTLRFLEAEINRKNLNGGINHLQCIFISHSLSSLQSLEKICEEKLLEKPQLTKQLLLLDVVTATPAMEMVEFTSGLQKLAHSYQNLKIVAALNSQCFSPSSSISSLNELTEGSTWSLESYELQPLSNNSLSKFMKQYVVPSKESETNKYLMYQCYMEEWLSSQIQIAKIPNLPKEATPAELFEKFMIKTALALHSKGNLINESFETNELLWISNYFSHDDVQIVLERSGCPLKKTGYQGYCFLHETFLHYFYVKGIIEAILQEDEDIIVSYCNPEIIARDPSLLDFFKGAANLNPRIKTACLKRVKQSRFRQSNSQSAFITAASNTITLLNSLGYNFSYHGLSKIEVPGAILSYGLFENTDFTSSNLHSVDFRGSWLRNAKLNKSIITDVLLEEPQVINIGSSVRCVACTEDGLLVMAGTVNGEMICFSRKHGCLKKMKNVKAHKGPIISCVFSQDNQMVLTRGEDNTLKVWDTNTVKLLRVILVSSSSLLGNAIRLNEKQIMGGDNNNIKIWNLLSGKTVNIFAELNRRVTCCSFSPDGRTILFASEDSHIYIWDIQLARIIKMFECGVWGDTCCSYNTDGSYIVAGGTDSFVRMWDTRTEYPPKIFQGHSGTVTSCQFSSDSTRIISGSRDKFIFVWDIETRCILKFEGHSSRVLCCSFFSNGKQIVSGSEDQTLRVWDTTSKKYQKSNACVLSCTFSHDGRQIMSASEDKTIRIWELASNNALRLLQGHTDQVKCCNFSPDDTQAVSGSRDKTVRLWDIASGTCIKSFQGHTSYVESCAFSPDGKQLVSGGWDYTVRIWKVASGLCTVLRGHQSGVMYCSFNRDGKYVVSCSHDRTVRLWDASGKLEKVLYGPNDAVTCCMLTSNNETLIAGSADNAIYIWNVRLETCQRPIKVSKEKKVSFGFSRDGKYAVLGFWCKKIQIWDVENAERIHLIEGLDSPIIAVAIYQSSNQRNFLVASGHYDGTVKCWSVSNSDLQLHWVSDQQSLNLYGVQAVGALGLSLRNTEIIEQRNNQLSSGSEMNQRNNREYQDFFSIFQ